MERIISDFQYEMENELILFLQVIFILMEEKQLDILSENKKIFGVM